MNSGTISETIFFHTRSSITAGSENMKIYTSVREWRENWNFHIPSALFLFSSSVKFHWILIIFYVDRGVKVSDSVPSLRCQSFLGDWNFFFSLRKCMHSAQKTSAKNWKNEMHAAEIAPKSKHILSSAVNPSGKYRVTSWSNGNAMWILITSNRKMHEISLNKNKISFRSSSFGWRNLIKTNKLIQL